jgi:peptide chain release factor subunit 3
MNSGANEWKPHASAASWSPSAGFKVAPPTGRPPVEAPTGRPTVQPPTGRPTAPPPPTAASAAPAPVVKEVSISMSTAPVVKEVSISMSTTQEPPTAATDTDTSDIMDENDPLWMVVLKIAQGNRAEALKMIADPDSLTQYPEVVAILASGSDDPMEDVERVDEVQELAQEVDTKMKVDEAPAPAPKSKKDNNVDDSNNDDDEVMEADAPLKEGDPREHFNLVFIGHVDAGKSTLSGNILYLTDNVDKRTIERYEKEAKERNRESWFLAFIMDTNEEERAKGKTVEVGKAHLETESKRYTILDAPGHKNYVPNMIMGASQADIGVLVISARKGEFETGFDRGGQTREHAMLAKTLGVTYLVVVVNKMDDPTVKWSKVRYDECITKLRPYLKSCGYTIKTEVKFLPISGLSGANVKDEVSKEECPWWSECVKAGDNNTNKSTLLGLLDSLELSGRDATAPLRIPILDRYTDRGTIAMGKVESGVIRPGMKVTLMPTRNTYKVDAVWANEDPVSAARPGENVLIKLAGAGMEDIRKGYVMCTNPPCRAVSHIICQIAIVEMPDNAKIMTAGFQAIFHAHCCEEECTITKIFETTNTKGQTTKGARFASVGMRCICMLEIARSVPVDTYESMPFLGRFTLRTEGKTIAIGKITKLPPKKT